MDTIFRLIDENFRSREEFVILLTIAGLFVTIFYARKQIFYAREQYKLQVKQQEDISRDEVSNEPETVTKVVPVVKAVVASEVELERIRRHFKIYSPPNKSIKAAFLLRERDEWNLQTTLPSGLFIRFDNDFPTVLSHLLSKIFGETVKEWDFRHLQKSRAEIEHIKKDDRSHYYGWQETRSVAWHPTENLIATTGYSGVTKLWDLGRSSLITKNPFWSTYSGGDTLCWSFDGSFFVTDKFTFSGYSGETVGRSESDTWVPSNYSSWNLENERGLSVKDSGKSHLSGSGNFNPWRPGTEMLLLHRYKDCTNLVLMNARSGEIEKIVHCGVPSFITDTAWHPGGNVIAVAFKDHNIRILEVEKNRIIDGLSAPYLVGWSPDGRFLIARKEKRGDSFIVWDSLEMKEVRLVDEIKEELWFKRFFKNISADGLRYIEISNDHTKLYSVETENEIFTLPGRNISAAWSPIDGGLLATCVGSETHIWRRS